MCLTHTYIYGIIIESACIVKVTGSNFLEPVVCLNLSYKIILGMCVFGKKE